MKRGPGSDDKAACRSIENDLMECWRSNSRLRSRCDSRKQDFSTFTLPRASHIRGLYILFRARFVTTRSTHGPLTGHPRYESINTEPNRFANKQRTAVVACSQWLGGDWEILEAWNAIWDRQAFFQRSMACLHSPAPAVFRGLKVKSMMTLMTKEYPHSCAAKISIWPPRKLWPYNMTTELRDNSCRPLATKAGRRINRPRYAARKAPGLNVEIRKTRKQKVMAWLLPAARAIR
ncbi:hypothetical protein CPAR01_01353 [Colletotrichum paranaense]|uniref:Uncharacterized protein n=1 Tax=Colletotrichum paranaense TaxID=1914294 RepID=A0ABQ9T8A8_9PEZI|nr:uncharacterized protein CPAR01_01353 [Colletotrichum paranaense]KAK1547386.1 hypothetical protein CPAR01_01353 [Colletotrichum paranaense]